MMKTILLVKMSSLGDVIHNLPVVSDIRAAIPQNNIDWVVEESFAAVPQLHAGVRRVLPIAMRRWRTGVLSRATRVEIGRFVNDLRAHPYDAIIDTQGLLKSALVACTARGARHGLDWRSAREPLAAFYSRTYAVPWTLHAVERNRQLAARALGYAVPNGANYGIEAPAVAFAWLPSAPRAILLHATSQERKLWPERDWIELGRVLARDGRRCVLPWHGGHERARSERLAQEIPGAIVPPQLALTDVAGVIAGAVVVAGVDTGLTHLAAALGVPTIGIYFATDPAATGLYGARAANVGTAGAPPSARDVIRAIERIVA